MNGGGEKLKSEETRHLALLQLLLHNVGVLLPPLLLLIVVVQEGDVVQS